MTRMRLGEGLCCYGAALHTHCLNGAHIQHLMTSEHKDSILRVM